MARRYRILFVLPVLAAISACAPSGRLARAPAPIEELPPIPERRGLLDVDLVYPREGALKPDADSTFLFGSVGTGDAELTINGLRIPLAPNGAFLAYVPVPDDARYTLTARADGAADSFVYSYASPPPATPVVQAFDAPLHAVVVGGRDTLATGSEIVHAYPAPDAERRWFFPPGTELTATGRSGGLIRIRMTGETDAWIDSSNVRFREPVRERSLSVGSVEFAPAQRYVDVKIDADRAPFLILPDVRGLGIVVYGRSAPAAVPPTPDFIERAAWQGASSDSANLQLDLSGPLWGFKAFYDDDGALVVRVRRPPVLDPSNPVRGLRIMVDPGHPPGGAIGPTGLTEAEANLDVALRLADLLRDVGADVVMTRTTASGLVSDSLTAIELWARVDLAVDENADLLVSIHNNAFPDGVNPFDNYGTETYYFHPFSRPLAEALLQQLVKVTGLPDLGAKQRSLALVRPSWMPSTLTESLFMMFPQQEAALRHADFQERLARAHLEGILSYLRNLGQ